MKPLWCWRCRREVPMLDEEEYAVAYELYLDCAKAIREFRQTWGLPLKASFFNDQFKPVTVWYERLTGMEDCHYNAVMHHRLALYGPPCKSCGKPLRTSRARFCASCSAPAN